VPSNRHGERAEHGASLVEYCLLIALIAVVVLLSLRFFGSSRDNSLSRSGSAIAGAIVLSL
jgi:Flp pilus assembly pilin Flp